MAMENPLFWWFLLGKMVIFMGYVSFREGTKMISGRRWWRVENGELSRSNPWNIWWSSWIVQKLHMCDAWNVPMWKRCPNGKTQLQEATQWLKMYKTRDLNVYRYVCRYDFAMCYFEHRLLYACLCFLQAGGTKYIDALNIYPVYPCIVFLVFVIDTSISLFQSHQSPLHRVTRIHQQQFIFQHIIFFF